jgi:hypothetical protein
MRTGFARLVGLVVACLTIPGCLQNAVHSVTEARQINPDSAHAVVVIGIGLDAAWPFAVFSLTLDEYSVEKQNTTGNCFRYNHIAATRPSSPAKVTYFAYKVPAGTYVYSSFNANADLVQSAVGSAFIAPPGRTVYFGDYVFVGNRTIEFRSDIAAARLGIRALLARGAVLEQAEPTTTARVHGFLCTP